MEPTAPGNVALRKESVDRNLLFLSGNPRRCKSLSARRAWIETPGAALVDPVLCVALRKESVDRNIRSDDDLAELFKSLSARRAWIETCFQRRHTVPSIRRSPQGERG